MEWTLVHDAMDGVIIATVEGKIRAEGTAEMAVQGVSLARAQGCTKFLIDYRLAEVDDSIVDTHEFMTNLPKLGITRTDRIAIVFSQEKERHDFAETVALNRGWNNIRYFHSDMDGARSWLLAERT